MLKNLKTHIQKKLSIKFNLSYSKTDISNIYSGDTNQSYKLEFVGDTTKSFFVKTNSINNAKFFVEEAFSLQKIADTKTILTPKVITTGTFEQHSYLVLEYININNNSNMYKLGEQLALLHKNTNNKFGWPSDNYIGSSVQYNNWCDNWSDFFIEYRLKPQFRIAQKNNVSPIIIKKSELLFIKLKKILSHYPTPSLLHGDLWSGNASFVNNTPIIFDTASYYGDRETDIAMTELFGGFSDDFYQAYNKVFPLTNGYIKRKNAYNLYHIINHYNLFGGAYIVKAEKYINLLLA